MPTSKAARRSDVSCSRHEPDCLRPDIQSRMETATGDHWLAWSPFGEKSSCGRPAGLPDVPRSAIAGARAGTRRDSVAAYICIEQGRHRRRPLPVCLWLSHRLPSWTSASTGGGSWKPQWHKARARCRARARRCTFASRSGCSHHVPVTSAIRVRQSGCSRVGMVRTGERAGGVGQELG